MATRVTLQHVSGASAAIPVPTRPADKGDTDPSTYIPKGMSSTDRQALREAALEWTDTLGGVMAHRHPTKGTAAQNMDHYRHGSGKDRVYGAKSVDDLRDSLNASGTSTDRSVMGQFLTLIVSDMKRRGNGVRRYLAKNSTFGSPNYGTNWFGVTAEGDTGWFYAVGSFLMTYGAHASRSGSVTTIRYRLFIYDRYNWDINPDGSSKDVSLPSSIEWALNEDEIAAAEGLEFNSYQKYFEKVGERYVVTDALMGSLIQTGDAANFDIVGAGTVHWARFEDATSSGTGPTAPATKMVDSGSER